MKKTIHFSLCFIAAVALVQLANAQTELASDQNPLFEESRSKYLIIADSVNKWHSTTIQNTYKAIDYLEDKKIAKAEKEAFKRELRMERIRRGYSGGYYHDYYYPSRYHNYNNRYYNNHFPNRYYRYNSNYNTFGYRNHSYLWSTIPLALTVGLMCR